MLHEGQPAVAILSGPIFFRWLSIQSGWNTSRHLSLMIVSPSPKAWWHLAHAGGGYSDDASHSGYVRTWQIGWSTMQLSHTGLLCT
jgi:hypothetical protein